MAEDQDKMNAATSPNTVVMGKKRARRINAWPLIMLIIAAGLIGGTLTMVAVKRQNAAKPQAVPQSGRNATALAKNIVTPMDGGAIAAKTAAPDKPKDKQNEKQTPATPAPPVTLPDKYMQLAVPESKKPAPQKVSEEVLKLRERQRRQFEAVLDGPIKVQMEDPKIKPRSTLNDELARVEQQIAQLGNQATPGYAERLAAAKAAAGDGGTGSAGGNAFGNGLNQFGAVGGNWQNNSKVEAPPTLFTIRTGSVIPATLISGINSDLPGQIVGQVSQDVYDTPTGKHLLIPQGSRLVGEYSSQIQYGQSRVFAVWQRVIFPDGTALDIGSMPGSSGAGYAGLRDRVNNHYVRIFGSAIMMSSILAGVEMTQNKGSTDGNNQRMADALSESLGQVLGGVIGEMLSKNMSISPTLEIRPGYRLNVMLVKDLVFKGSYQAFDYIK